MAKRILAGMLSLLMLFSLLPVNALAVGGGGEDESPVAPQELPAVQEEKISLLAETEGDFTYTVAQECATITAYTGAGGAVEIPAQLGGYPVTAIGSRAFQNCTTLTSVALPDSITSLGSYVFQGCTALERFGYPIGLITVNSSGGLFNGCTALKQITVPEGVTVLPDSLFKGCNGLEEILLPEGLTQIGNSTFQGCTALKSIALPDGVTTLGRYAFQGCTTLTAIDLPDTITTMGSYVFQGCAALEQFGYPAGLTTVNSSGGLFDGCTALKQITVPEGVTILPDNLFKDCDELEKVFLPESLTRIGSNTFQGCTALTAVALPQGVNFIGSRAFNKCTSLNAIALPGSLTVLNAYVFQDCVALKEVTLPEGLTQIGNSAFNGCTALTAVDLPDSVTALGSAVFEDCTALEQFDYPAGLTTISASGNLFRGCTSLKQITVPEGVTVLPDNLFRGSNMLETVLLPDGLAQVGSRAFQDCTALTSVTLPDSVTTLGRYAFQNCKALTQIAIPEGVTALPDDLFSGCGMLEEVLLPEGLTQIGGSAFKDCAALTGVVLPQSLTSLGSRVFQGCSTLTDIALPQGITTLNSYLFTDCTSLEAVTLPENLTQVGSWAFSGCAALAAIDLPDSVTTLGSYAFMGCTRLETVTLPDGLTRLDSNVFQGCTALTAIDLPDSVTTLGSAVFQDCTALEQFGYPAGLKSVSSGGSLFAGCTALTEVTVPEGVTVLPSYVFKNCTFLEQVNLPDSLTEIGSYAFQGCTGLREISIPPGVTIDKEAFLDCVVTGTCGGDISWSLDMNEQQLTLEGTGPMEFEQQPDPSDAIPWKGLQTLIQQVGISPAITTVASYAFQNCPNLLSIVLPEGIESIGSHAFDNCTALERVELPTSLETVETAAFNNCQNMDTIIFCGEPPQIAQDAIPEVPGCTAYYPKSSNQWTEDVLQAIPYVEWSTWDDTLPTRDIVLLLDISNSMAGERISGLKQAVVSFVDKVGGRLTNTRIAMVPYAATPFVAVPLSTDVSYLRSSVNKLEVTSGTNYTNALSMATQLLGSSDADVKSLILFSDGEPLDDVNNILSQSAEMRKDFYIYTVGLTPTDESRKLLINVAGTEQNYFEAEDIDALAALFVKISENIGDENLTKVTMVRDGVTSDVLTETQSFEWGGGEQVELQVEPYWADNVPGSIRITQRGRTILEDPTGQGSFSAVAPGQLFDPLESIYVVLVDQDGAIAAMVKTKIDIVLANTGRLDIDPSQMALTIFQGKDAENKSYQLSGGAWVTVDGERYQSNANGVVCIPSDIQGSITVEKEGFITRTVTPEQLAESKKIYLSHEPQNRPVITAVWLENTDVLTQYKPMAMLWETPVTIRAEVSWGTGGPGTLALIQGADRIEFTGNELRSVVLANEFDWDVVISIAATDGAGNTTVRDLKLDTGRVSGSPEFLNNAGLNLGTSFFSFTFPEGMDPDFMAGKQFKAGVTTLLPFTATMDEFGKVYVAFGVQPGSLDWKKGDKKVKIQSIIKNFKESGIFNTEKITDNAEKLLNLEKMTGSFGVSADFVVAGFLEGYWNETDGLVILDAGALINPYANVSWSLPFMLAGFIPMYFEAFFIGDITAKLDIIFNQAVENLDFYGTIDGALTLGGGVGVGAKDVLYAAGGIEGKLTPTVVLADPVRATLVASLNAYAKAGIIGFEHKHAWPPVLEAVWYPLPKNGDLSTLALETEAFYQAENYTRKDLSYLDAGSRFVANQGQVSVQSDGTEGLDLTEQTLKTNIYRESTPEYLRFDDGTALAVWLDGADSDFNNTQLYYSYYDGGSWSSPALVSDGQTLDNAPQLALVDGTAYLVWQDATRQFSGQDDLTTIAPYFDISVAAFTPGSGFGTPTTFARAGLDLTPTICGGADGSVYVAWVSNDANDWFGSTGENSINYAVCRDGVWSEVTEAYTKLGAVSGLTVDGTGGLHLAYCQETDQGLRLYENGKPVRDAQDTEAFNPSYFQGTLYWMNEGSICWEGGKSAPALPGMGRMQMLSGGGEQAALYTTSSEGLYSVLNLSYYNAELRQWSDPVALTDGSTFVGAFSGVMTDDGTVEVLANLQEVTGTIQSEDPYGASHLSRITLAPTCDLTMGELVYLPSSYQAGELMELFFDLTNSGSRTISSATIEVKDEKGTVLSSIVMDDVLSPGQTISTSTYFPVASGAAQTVTVTATPDGLSDGNPADNSRSASLSFEDLAVEQASWGELEAGGYALSASVVNYGYADRTNITVELRKGAKDGPVVDTASISALEPLELEVVSFTLADPQDDVYYFTLRDSGDVYTMNDSDFAALGLNFASQFADIISVTSTQTELKLNNSQAGTCMVAIYDGSGRMLSVGSADVAANAGTVRISYPQFVQSQGQKVKVFFVDADQAPLYPCLEQSL